MSDWGVKRIIVIEVSVYMSDFGVTRIIVIEVVVYICLIGA